MIQHEFQLDCLGEECIDEGFVFQPLCLACTVDGPNGVPQCIDLPLSDKGFMSSTARRLRWMPPLCAIDVQGLHDVLHQRWTVTNWFVYGRSYFRPAAGFFTARMWSVLVQVAEGGTHVWKLKRETFVLQTPRHAVAAEECQLRVGPENGRGGANHPAAGGQAERHAECPSEFAHEHGVRDRIRRGRHVRAGHPLVVNRAGEEAVHVFNVDPADTLPAVADGAAKAEARQRREPRQRAAAWPEHKTRSQDDLSHMGRCRMPERLFPRTSHRRCEANAKGGILVADDFRRIAVDMR